MTIAIVTAGGTGSRMASCIPKQFLSVNDQPVIVYTLRTLQENANIDAICIACLAGWDKVLDSYIKQHHFDKAKWIVGGGSSGQESIFNCLQKISAHVSDDDLVTVHDGNRPLLDDFVINESIRVAREYGNAVAAIPCTEAMLHLVDQKSDKLTSQRYADRSSLVRTQTPHTFRFNELFAVYKKLSKSGATPAVAPCTAMIDAGYTIHLSPGSELNFKITTQNDLDIFTSLIRTGV